MPLINTNNDRPESTGNNRRRSTTRPLDEVDHDKQDLFIETQPKDHDESDNEDEDTSDYEGYSSDGTSSYDSGDGRYSQLFNEIVHSKQAPRQETGVVPGLADTSCDKPNSTKKCEALSPAGCAFPAAKSLGVLTRKRKLRTLKESDGRKLACRIPAAKVSSSPFLAGNIDSKAYESLLDNPEVMKELCKVTKPFYKISAPAVAASAPTLAVAPLLEQGLQNETGAVKDTKRPRLSIEGVTRKQYPRPATMASSGHTLNEIETSPSRHMVPSQTSPACMTTFREALGPSTKPRLVTLSFPPFIVVHVNDACCQLTGYTANEILGLPLSNLLEKNYHKELRGSVTAMHDRLAPIIFKQEEKYYKCFVKVSLVGPEMEVNDQEKDGEQVYNDDMSDESDTEFYVTHYGIELEPVGNSGGMNGARRNTIHLVSSERSSYCGVLG